MKNGTENELVLFMKQHEYTLEKIVMNGISIDGPIYEFCKTILNDTSVNVRKNMLKKVSTVWFKEKLSTKDEMDEIISEVFLKRPSRLKRTPSKSSLVELKKPQAKKGSNPLTKVLSFNMESSLLYQSGTELVNG